MSKSTICDIVLVILIIIENAFLLFMYRQGYTSQTVNAIVCFLSSFLIGIVVLFKFYGHREIDVNKQVAKFSGYTTIFLIIVGLVVLNMLTIDLIKASEVNAISDIIPTVQLQSKRFLEGLYPYTPGAYKAIGQIGRPTYFPMHWLPYTISGYFHFDPRTVTFSIWAIAATVLMYRSTLCRNLLLRILIPLLVVGCYFGLVKGYGAIISATVETMIAGYYMLFIIGINQKNVYLTALFITFCLLSRYFIALWLPLWAFVLFVSGNRKQLYKTVAGIVVFVCILFVIPFLSKDWSFAYSALSNYSTAGIGEWLHDDALGRPVHLYAGTGFAYLFYEQYPPALMYKGYKTLTHLMFILPLATLLVMGIWYWCSRRRINYRIFLMASFKIYLSVFLALVIVPYVYLSVSAIFISVAIFAEQARYNFSPPVVSSSA